MYLFQSLKDLISTYLPAEQVALVQHAYLTARDAHEGQSRSSGEPYITHPVAVARILADMHLPVSKTSDPCRLENGAYVFSDYASLKSGIPQAFSCTYGDQTYTGSYIGCAALLCKEEGQLERFACGGGQSRRDGAGALHFEHDWL